ncbi:rolling circle replication-associated protein [Spiroplasma endosymbiont of Diplazon laetatorius]|uniref:rolling circle replication-associated protein n=1 Tax=Spiroplasma endosymbiont of Diplazon laetatorius TaxID=3066322 RepID=UPI0030CC5567
MEYYCSKTYYGDMVRTSILPLSSYESNLRNKGGVKNTGKNKEKLNNSKIRSKGRFIRKSFHNFYNQKTLSFLTLTYAKNMQDIKQAKYDLKLFFQKLKYWFYSEKRSKFRKNQELKYVSIYEYQKRGAVHFHIILNVYIPNSIILTYWPHGINWNVKVKGGTTGRKKVVKYLSKYMSKVNKLDSKDLNKYDLNIKSYHFSSNCSNPKTKIGVLNINPNDLTQFMVKTENLYLFKLSSKCDFLFGLVCDRLKIFDFEVDLDPYIHIAIKMRQAIIDGYATYLPDKYSYWMKKGREKIKEHEQDIILNKKGLVIN